MKDENHITEDPASRPLEEWVGLAIGALPRKRAECVIRILEEKSDRFDKVWQGVLSGLPPDLPLREFAERIATACEALELLS